jgi:hypothetical protein
MSSSRLRSGKRTSSPALRALSWLAPALFALFLTKPAAAYPWMLKHGYSNCSTCHADPSGGELLTAYGRVMSDAFLSTQWKSEESASRAPRLRLALPIAARSKNALPRPALPLLTPFAQVTPVAPPQAPNAPDAAPPAEVSPSPDESAPDASTAPGSPPEGAPPVDATAPSDASATPGESPVSEPAPEAPPNAPEPPANEPAATTPPAPPEPEPEAPAEETPAEETPAEESSEPELPFYEPFFGLFPLPERLLLGGSIRLASIYKPEADEDQYKFFPMQIDLYGELSIAAGFGIGGSLGVAKVPAGSPHARAAQITSDQGDGYNLISRTHYLRYDFGEGSYTVRAGRLNVPFGLRMSEHVMWIREQTQTDRESDQQSGVALAMGFEQLRFEVMGIAGNYQIEPDAYRERGYSGYVEYAAWEKGAIGVSSLLTFAGDDRLNPVGEDTTRQAHGVFGRMAFGELAVLMVEADVLLRSRRDMGYVGFAQLDVEPIRGLHFIGTGEVLDAGKPNDADSSVPGSGEAKFGGWLSAQWFFASHFDVRVDGIVRQEEPFQLLGQLHVYL